MNGYVWNEEELEYQQAPVEESELQRYIEEGLAVEALTNHMGWKVVASSLQESIEDIKNRLIHEKDVERFRRFQETARAYQSIFDFVEHRINDAKALSKKQDPSDEG